MFASFRQKIFGNNNRTKKNPPPPPPPPLAIYQGKRRTITSSPRTKTIKTIKTITTPRLTNNTPFSWKQLESNTPVATKRPSPISTTIPLFSDECQLQDGTTSPLPSSCPGNMTASFVLGRYTTNHGHTLNIDSNTFSKKLGDMDCAKLKKKLQTLLPYLNCDVSKKIHKILLYHHDIKPSQMSIAPLLFRSMPQLREIHIGIPSTFRSSPTKKNNMYGLSITEHDTPTTGKYILVTR